VLEEAPGADRTDRESAALIASSDASLVLAEASPREEVIDLGESLPSMGS
jgi:hypothetical protein